MSGAVSIIVPYLNQARYIAEAIESVQAQTFGDWELLLVNDGSSDASVSIAASYAQNDERIHLLCHPGAVNKGAAASRNLGIQHAKGSFLAFLDADDIYLPGKLARETTILNRTPSVAAIYGRTHWHYEDNSLDSLEDLGVTADRIYRPPELVTRIILRQEGAIPCTCSVMVRRECALAVGGFSETLALYEDQTLWVRLFATYSIFVSSHCLAIYRQHPFSTSAAAIRRGVYHETAPHAAQLAFLEWVENFIRSEAITDQQLVTALSDKLAIYRSSWRRRLRAQLQRAIRAARMPGGRTR
jgi:glycosyltransferase involved in cell wall biosynthesis